MAQSTRPARLDSPARGPRPGHIVTFRNDRLGGRLTAMLNAVRLAMKTDAPLAVHWHQIDDHSAPFNDPFDFFQPDFIARHFVTRDAFAAMRERTSGIEALPTGAAAELAAHLGRGDHILIDKAIGLILLADETEAGVRAELSAIWGGFPFADAVTSAMAAIRARVGPEATAYHIRRGDVLSVERAMNRAWPNKYIIDEVFEAHMARTVAAGVRPVIFSDDTAAVRRFIKIFPDAVAGADLVPDSGIAEGQRDLLELFAMSLCGRIVAPPQSAFSTTAATLGGGRLIDVTADLPPAEAEAAMDLMERRLAADVPGAIRDSRGRVGQNLAHLEVRAREQGRHAAVAAVMGEAIAAGARISYLWPMQAELLLGYGDFEGVRRLRAGADGTEIYFAGDDARLSAFAAIADLALGERGTGARRALSAYAAMPTANQTEEVASLFYALGYLDGANGLPLSEAAAGLMLRPPRVTGEIPFVRHLVEHNALREGRRRALPALAPLHWDWAPFLRLIPRGALARAPRRRAYDKQIARLRERDGSADAASLIATYDMHLAEDEGWFQRLADLAAADPGDAMLQHRLSHGALTWQNRTLFRDAAEAAVRAAPGVAAHLAWRGFARLRTRAPHLALSDLTTAAETLALPALHQFAANAARLAGDAAAEADHLDLALALAPRSGAALIARAEFRERQGDAAGAEADLATARSLPAVPVRALPRADDAMTTEEAAVEDQDGEDAEA